MLSTGGEKVSQKLVRISMAIHGLARLQGEMLSIATEADTEYRVDLGPAMVPWMEAQHDGYPIHTYVLTDFCQSPSVQCRLVYA
jgi:hypothetical protein